MITYILLKLPVKCISDTHREKLQKQFTIIICKKRSLAGSDPS